MATILYPYDPSGVATTNLIKDELRSVQPPADINQASFIIPLKAPFFVNTLEIWTGLNKKGTKLVLGRDYFISHDFAAGSNFLGKPLAGGIVFTNSLYTGNVYIHYQTLGGDFVLNDAAMLEAVSRKHYSDVRFVTWDQLKGVPSAFPPNAHQHVVTEIKTMADVVTALNSISAALIGSLSDNTTGGNEATALGLIRQHISATSNAHTPSAVGLGNVSNYTVANEADSVALRNDRYMTPSTTGYLIRRYIAAENLQDLRDTIYTMGQAIATIELGIRQINAKLQNIDLAIANINDTMNMYRQEIVQVNQKVLDAVDQSNLATTIASQSLSQAAATEANLQLVSERVNHVIYADNIILPPGEHMVVLPPGNSMRILLVGGGGGSGRWYNLSSDYVPTAGGPESGEESVLWYLGPRSAPLEPLPLLVAGAGLAGSNSFGNNGRANSGNGGTCTRFRKDRIKASEIKNIDLTVDLIAGPSTTAGTAGTAGDTANTQAFVTGVGGWAIDSSGDGKYHQTYGRGGRGVTRAGMGGSGGRWEIVVQNDQTEDIRMIVSVGRAGKNARSAVNDETVDVVQRLQCSGVAVLTLVN